MASSLYSNSQNVCFESVLTMEDPGMISMFRALNASALEGFLWCPAVIFESELVECFNNGSVKDGLVVSTVNGVSIEISEQLLVETFELPVDGLSELSEMAKDKIFDAQSIVSLSREPFLESWRANFVPGQGSTAVDLKVINLLTDLHLSILEELAKEARAHDLLWTKTCCSTIFEGSPGDRGGVIARTNTNTRSSCWIRTMLYVNGEWIVEPCAGRWVKIPQMVISNEVPHGLLWTKTCCSTIFEGSPGDRGGVIARTNTNTRSSCWIRTMLYVNGEWIVEPCAGRWVKIPQMVISNEVHRHRQYDDTLPSVSVFFRLMRKIWADVCFEVVDFCASRRLLPVGSVNLCRGLTLGGPVFQVASRQSPVFAFRVSQFCSVFIDFSLFNWLPSADIIDFLSSIALSYLAFRGAQISQNSVSVVPSVHFSVDQRLFSSSSAESSSSLHFDTTDVDATVSSLPPISLDFSAALADFHAILSEQINESQSGISSRLHKIEQVLRDSLSDQAALFKNLSQEARQEGRSIDDVQTLRFNEFRKNILAQNASLFVGLADVRKEVQEVNSKVDIMASRVNDVQKDVEATKEAISHQLFEFQSQAQENHNILHAQLSELVDYIHRGSADKKGESGSRGLQQPSNVQIEDSAVRPPSFVQRVEIAQRHIVETVLDADRNAESLERQDAAERDRERRIREESTQVSKILTDKTVHRFVSLNDKAGAEEVFGESKTKAVSKKRSAADIGAAVTKKKRTIKKKSVTSLSTLEMVAVAQEAVPIQTIETFTVSPYTETNSNQPADETDGVKGVDADFYAPTVKIDEQVADPSAIDETSVRECFEPTVEVPAEETRCSSADDVDFIIQQVIEETREVDASADRNQPAVTEERHWFDLPYEDLIEKWVAERPVVTASDTDEEDVPMDVGTADGDQHVQCLEEKSAVNYDLLNADEQMSLDNIILTIPVDVPLPSCSMEITKIQMGEKIKIPEVTERTWFLNCLPSIPAYHKGKAIFVEKDPIKGNPAQEHYFLINADIDLLVELRAKIIDEVAQFFHSFSLRKLATFNIEDMYKKEEQVLSWGETESPQGESGRRGTQQPSNVQIEDSAVRPPSFVQRVEIAQRHIVETVLDADRNAESLERQDAAERDRERRIRERHIVETVLDADRNAESLERQDAAERDRERRIREVRMLKRRRRD
ncbi:B-cell receptor-associated protein 31-like [Dorcoceras hygrometricum]|uniref:B-cell receptor-associated protein 31-like n=1 Tax=Dorcoceras hygrometricum TaxID=472368 RepID=A0A2Z7BUN6_9LAMI|nr:B-cell receptor-associated protein 31-like [Dorcoceras hygrometricum]